MHFGSAPYKAREYKLEMAKSGNVGKGLYMYTDGSGIAKAKSHQHSYYQSVDISNLNIKKFISQREYDRAWTAKQQTKEAYNKQLIKEGYDSIQYSSVGHTNNIAIIKPETIKELQSGEVLPIK